MTIIKALNTKDNIQAKISTSSHEFIADEPITLGGENAGPTPDELLASALGACTAITLRMYINHKKIAVEDIHVEVNLNFNKEENSLVDMYNNLMKYIISLPTNLYEILMIYQNGLKK